MSTGDQVNRIRKYIDQLKKEDKISHALGRLDKIDMTVALLTETGVGKEVNRLKNHPGHGQKAQKIVEKWRKLASEQSSEASSNNHASSNNNNGNRKRPSANNDEEQEDVEELRSSQNISFADALKAPKVPPKKIRVIIKEPEAPKAVVKSEFIPLDFVPKAPMVKKEEVEVDPAQFTARKGKPMKMYAGRKQTKFVKKVDTLYNLAMTACMQNIDSFTHGPLPTVYQVFHPVLARCTPEQLDRIESHNPHFEEDSDPLWQAICVKAFPKAPTSKYQDESWKHCYKRLIAEREDRLRQISNKIKKENKLDQLTTKMADAVAPGNVLQRQIKNGTFCRTGQVPHAIEVTKARRGIFNNGTKAGMAAIPAAMRLGGVGPSTSSSSSSKSSSSSTQNPAKKGALMQKTLRMMKSRSKR